MRWIVGDIMREPPYATFYPSDTKTPVVRYQHPGVHVYPQEASSVVIIFF